jgi:hypothetical protein
MEQTKASRGGTIGSVAMGILYSMRAWIERRRAAEQSEPEPEPDSAKRQRAALAGKYVLLYTYLENRFATSVVLTFSEIEDLLGFTLPDLARAREDWWTSPDPSTARPRFSDSWILANRTARPNLPALTVAFDRAS